MKNILITGGGAPGAPGIIKGVRQKHPEFQIFSCDATEETAGKYLSDHYFTVPLGTDPDYIPSLLGLCQKNGIETVLPITTRELQPLALAKASFQKHGTQVLVSDEDQLEIANDKGKLYQHLCEHGIPVPNFKIAKSFDEYLAAKHHLQHSSNKFIIKPCVANGSRGFRIIDKEIDNFNLLFNHKPNTTFIKERELDEILKGNSFPNILISEYLPGKEYTVDCLLDEGEVKLIIPRSRDKMNNGISVAGTIEQNDEIISYCHAILSTIKLHGPIGIQVKYSDQNKPLLVEINPRIQGTTVACIGAGINIPALCFEDLSVVNSSDLDIKWGTKFIRYYSELYFNP